MGIEGWSLTLSDGSLAPGVGAAEGAAPLRESLVDCERELRLLRGLLRGLLLLVVVLLLALQALGALRGALCPAPTAVTPHASFLRRALRRASDRLPHTTLPEVSGLGASASPTPAAATRAGSGDEHIPVHPVSGE